MLGKKIKKYLLQLLFKKQLLLVKKFIGITHPVQVQLHSYTSCICTQTSSDSNFSFLKPNTCQIHCYTGISYRKEQGLFISHNSSWVQNPYFFFYTNLRKKYKRMSHKLTDWQQKGTSDKLLQASNSTFLFLHSTKKAWMEIYIMILHFSTTLKDVPDTA